MEIYSEFDWKLYAWVKRGNRRTKVLEYLDKAEKPVTATVVKKAQKVDIAQAAFTLNELCTEKLAKCSNPEKHHGKLYVITNKGRGILKKLKN